MTYRCFYGGNWRVEKNKYLSNYKSSLETKIFELKAQNPNLNLKSIMQLVLHNIDKVSHSDFFDVFEQFIEARKSTLTYATFKKYNTLFNHLKKFSKKQKRPINFETLDFNFFDKLQNYFISLRHGNNTVFKHFQNLFS